MRTSRELLETPERALDRVHAIQSTVQGLCLAWEYAAAAAVGIIVAGMAALGIVVAIAIAAVLVIDAHGLGVIGGGITVVVAAAIAWGGAFGGSTLISAALIHARQQSTLGLVSAVAGWAHSRSGEARQGRNARRVAAPAKKLVAVASRLLPVAERARYLEEYRSELWDLAAAGAGCCRQVGYGARQVLSAMPLRSAVLAPRRRGAPL